MKKTSPPQPSRVAVTTLGCKVNQFESAAFLSEFAARGLTIVPFSESADIYVINTCAVTARAGAQSRQLIRRALKANPKARLIITGCYAQVASEDILALVEQPLCLVGNAYKHRLVEVALADSRCDLEMYLGDLAGAREVCPLTVTGFAGRTRSYLKVQDGCNQFCTYCIVPYARGRSRSVPPEAVLAQARLFVEQGFREMVLTGIHLGHYGLDLTPPMHLTALVDRLLAQALPVRYRLSSLEPTEITEELLARIAEAPPLMPHLHIPLQSGDDRILAAMHRRYTRQQFAEIIARCAAAVPGLAIGVDVLVGFPGEDEAAFRNTYDLLAGLPVSYLHVFPYSRRPGTLAAKMPGQVPGMVKDERVALLRTLDQHKRRAFYASHLGETCQVLAEPGKGGKTLRGFTEHYVPVTFAAPASAANTVVAVRLDRLSDEGVIGTLTAGT
ncbi:MAG TPA: tRNA (N(6)-L-threonylcarbamoyladenosine(37)-C(2))-methylthiotransferase MtaB [Desulfurivibrionaceae bacterium]|nr:tRNA (N(6)-L-threonylcarbamoyladenosine(37)-C(2))-methylthiotransferase MtaB [Desulfurivibrionaceae bacterium]